MCISTEIGGIKYSRITIHCPNIAIDKNDFLLEISDRIKHRDNVILGCNFNFANDLQQDKIGGSKKHQEC